jgi:hypothetical protein
MPHTIPKGKIARLKRILKIYRAAINFRTLYAFLIAILATWLSYRFNLIYNLDLTIISVAVVFPLVFTLQSAFRRREKALEHLGRAKGALAAINYCFSYSKKIDETEKQKIYAEVKNVKKELLRFLYTESNDKEKLNIAVSKIQHFISEHRSIIGRSLSLRVFRLMRDVIMGIENTISIKTHRTPFSIRAYCLIFIYAFPFFYAPSLIKNIQYPDTIFIDIINSAPIPFLENRFALIIYGLNIIITFFLITLYNVQEQIENPFDQKGVDDIILDNYLIDY